MWVEALPIRSKVVGIGLHADEVREIRVDLLAHPAPQRSAEAADEQLLERAVQEAVHSTFALARPIAPSRASLPKGLCRKSARGSPRSSSATRSPV